MGVSGGREYGYRSASSAGSSIGLVGSSSGCAPGLGDRAFSSGLICDNVSLPRFNPRQVQQSRVRILRVALMGDKEGDGRFFQQTACDTAENKFTDPAVTVTAHDYRRRTNVFGTG